ncbi:uncharacterized protein LOC144579927 [Callithrix jacchus]
MGESPCCAGPGRHTLAGSLGKAPCGGKRTAHTGASSRCGTTRTSAGLWSGSREKPICSPDPVVFPRRRSCACAGVCDPSGFYTVVETPSPAVVDFLGASTLPRSVILPTGQRRFTRRGGWTLLQTYFGPFSLSFQPRAAGTGAGCVSFAEPSAGPPRGRAGPRLQRGRGLRCLRGSRPREPGAAAGARRV